jgi:hypothetical protein
MSSLPCPLIVDATLASKKQIFNLTIHPMHLNALQLICLNFFGCLTTDAFASFCLLICLTDSNELFFIVILVLSYLLVSLVPY